MPIRLFTSGTHESMNGTLSFSNDQVEKILEGTQKADMEMIPFVLGHPKNNLPIVGWLKKTAIKKYTEGEKVSLGFERDDAELSDESIQAIRDLGSDKISIRIQDGAIRHIGLVKKAAVEENNGQNFSQDDLSGIFYTSEGILEKQQNDFSKFLNDIKSIFKSNNMADEKKTTANESADMAALIKQNEQLTKSVSDLQKLMTHQLGKTQAIADFSADEYKHLNDKQKQLAAGIMVDLGSDEGKTAFKSLIKELAKPNVVVRNGSRTTDLGKPSDKFETVGDIVRSQMKEA